MSRAPGLRWKGAMKDYLIGIGEGCSAVTAGC